MFGLDPGVGRDRPLRLLCLGAHADDVEIGAGGTVLRLLAERSVEVTSVVYSGSPERSAEARAAASALFAGAASATVLTPGFRDGYLPTALAEVKAWTQETLGGLDPDLVLTHRRLDAHQDHRVVAGLAWQTWRRSVIAEYEIPKWDADLDRPSAYVRLDEPTLDRKLAALAEHFPSQHAKPWYDAETFRGLARLRGVEAGCRYAEAFHCSKLVW